MIPWRTDLNTVIYSGIYMGNGLVNAPNGSSEWFHIEVLRHLDTYTVQKAYPFTNGYCPVYIRTQTAGTWNAWRLFNPGTANTGQVLSGYTFSSANGVNLTGTLQLGVQSAYIVGSSNSYTATESGSYLMVVDLHSYYGTTYASLTWSYSCSGTTLLWHSIAGSRTNHDCPLGILVAKLSSGQNMSITASPTGGSYEYEYKNARVVKLS